MVKVTKLTDNTLMQAACAFTINAKESKMSLGKIYQCMHSPMRTQLFWVEMIDIPTFVSVHLVRHTQGVTHYVKSNREDRNINIDGSSLVYKGFTSEYFRSKFTYKNGKLFWKDVSDYSKMNIGDEAGGIGADGTWMIGLDNDRLYRSIIIYMMFHNVKPPVVDHIDRNRLNDNIENLRAATQSLNLINRKYNNKTGYKGVKEESSGKFSARIHIDKKEKHLGRYDTPEDAALAYDIAALKYYGAFALLNFADCSKPITRDDLVNHAMLINAEALITMARKRLCTGAHKKTQEIMKEIRCAVIFVDPELADNMVVECEFRNGYCPELKPCGRHLTVKRKM